MPRLLPLLPFLAACSGSRPLPILPREDTGTPTVHETGDPVVDPPDDTAEIIGGFTWLHLPILLVDTDGRVIEGDLKVDGRLEVIRDHEGTLRDLGEAPRTMDVPIGIEIHGSSASGFDKHAYRFEFRDELGEDMDRTLLDMPDGSDWVLNGPYSDKSLLRNALAYTLGRAMAEGSEEWQPRFEFCELFINHTYQGVYLAVERVQRDADRLDLPVPSDSAAEGDISGGYIVKIDQHRNSGWDTALGTPIDYHYPLADDITAEQDRYLRAYFDGFEAVLASPGFPDAQTGYPAWLEVGSWVDHYIVNELSHNVDAYRLSAYLYKDADADGCLLHAGPLWDFNLGFGNVDYCYCWQEDGFVIESLTACGYPEQFPFWWLRLLSDPAFTAALRCRWEALRADVLSDEAIVTTIATLAEAVAEAEPRDHDAWGNLGVYLWPNYFVGDTWEEELDYLRTWTLTRAAWLDGDLPGECIEQPAAGAP